MRKINRSLAGRSIRLQLICYISLFIVLPLSIGLVFLDFYLQNVIKDNQIRYDNYTVTQMRDHFDRVIEASNYCVSMMMINSDFLADLRIVNNDQKDYELYSARKGISNRITELENSVLNAIGGKLMILTESGYSISSYSISKTKSEYRDKNWYQDILDNGRKLSYCNELSMFYREIADYTVEDYRYFYIGRCIKDYSGKNCGLVLVQINADQIWGNDGGLSNGGRDGNLYYVREGVVLLMKNKNLADMEAMLVDRKEWEGRSVDAHNSEAGKRYYISVSSDYSGNYLVYQTDTYEYLKQSLAVTRALLMFVMFLIILSIAIMLYISSHISRPLMDTMDEINNSGDTIVKISKPKTGFMEINNLIDCYNRERERIIDLISRVEQESRLKEKAHYEALMSQISPHFIFNTVNSIRLLARAYNETKTESALSSLGEILHAVYRNNDGMTTIGEETALLQAYVDIMKLRFGNTFTYNNFISTDIYFYEIPSFTLQPIVENAILHGVKNMNGGQIIVSAVEYTDAVIISVFNNGKRADKDFMEKLLRSPEAGKSNYTGIALYNINARLKMLYGDSFGLIFNEHVTAGFEIWVRVKKHVRNTNE